MRFVRSDGGRSHSVFSLSLSRSLCGSQLGPDATGYDLYRQFIVDMHTFANVCEQPLASLPFAAAIAFHSINDINAITVP